MSTLNQPRILRFFKLIDELFVEPSLLLLNPLVFFLSIPYCASLSTDVVLSLRTKKEKPKICAVSYCFAKKRDILIVRDVSIPQPEVIQSQPGFCFVRKKIHITSKFYLQNKYSLTATHQAKNTSNELFRWALPFRGSKPTGDAPKLGRPECAVLETLYQS